MPEMVGCSECGASYDSDSHPFCPRCGSTSRGTPVPGAVASAARRAPGRRRVQASGVVLLAIGLLFLASSAASFLIPAEEAAEPLVDLMAAQPGGAVAVHFPAPEAGADGTLASNATVRLLTLDGDEVANATVAAGGEARLEMDGASARLLATQGDASWNRTVLALRGDTVTLRLPEGGGGDGAVALSDGVKAATDVARYLLLAMALLLVVGGLCAILLRLFALAAAGAVTGGLFGLLALVGFLAAGLLFALPFGLCAYFILRGRRHFHRRAAPPGTPPAAPPTLPPGRQPPT